MKLGMLWFDNDSKSDLAAKLNKAAAYYKGKYGSTPTLCFVNPSMIPVDVTQAAGIELRATRSVMPNHFWLGVKEG